MILVAALDFDDVTELLGMKYRKYRNCHYRKYFR